MSRRRRHRERTDAAEESALATMARSVRFFAAQADKAERALQRAASALDESDARSVQVYRELLESASKARVQASAAAASYLLAKARVEGASPGAEFSLPQMPGMARAPASPGGVVTESDLMRDYVAVLNGGERDPELQARWEAQQADRAASGSDSTASPEGASPPVEQPVASPPSEPVQAEAARSPSSPTVGTPVDGQRRATEQSGAKLEADLRRKRDERAAHREERAERRWWKRQALTPAEVMCANQVTPGPLERPRQYGAPKAFF